MKRFTNLKDTERQRNTKRAQFLMIPALEAFENTLEKRCRELIPGVTPTYAERFDFLFQDAQKRHLSPCRAFEEYVVLDDRYKRLADLLSSLHEVKYSWNRLVKVFELLKIDNFVFKEELFSEGEWLRYCSDSLWYADYGFCERMIAFMKKFKRILKLENNDPETEILLSSIKVIEELRKSTKKSCDPLVHKQISLIDESKMRQFWGLYLLSFAGHNLEFEFTDFLNIISSLDREVLREETPLWIRSNYKIVSNIFKDLSTISLQSLTIKGKT
jgi:hypothetical protein